MHSKGTLELEGYFDNAQLWPEGSSDADTLKVIVPSAATSFRFREMPSASFRPTRAFVGATVVGAVRRPVVDANGHVVVRLEGVDAPELHYRPTIGRLPSGEACPHNGEFRQCYGEAATTALRGALREAGTRLQCIVRTRVDDPDEAFDTYGRLVGEIRVRVGRQWLSINRWLLTSGWALPSLYASQLPEEIREVVALGSAARRARRGVWRHLRQTSGRFEWLSYAGRRADRRPDDAGTLIVPKLFRRQARWAVLRHCGIERESFRTYLAEHADRCFETHEFLERGPSGAPQRRLDEFVSPSGGILCEPDGLVFEERPSRIERR